MTLEPLQLEGTGEWLRGQTERFMLAFLGKPVFLHGNHTTVLEAARREHSRKPEEPHVGKTDELKALVDGRVQIKSDRKTDDRGPICDFSR